MRPNRKHRQKQKPKKNKTEQKLLQTEQEANSRGTGNTENNHRKNSGKNLDPLTEKTTFVDDLGMDSLDFFQMLIDLEETYDIHIDAEDAEEIVTISDAVETLRRATKGKRNGK